MSKTWQRQAVGLAAGACLLTGMSAAQAAPVSSGLIDLGGLTITNGHSEGVDFDLDGHDDFTFSVGIDFDGNVTNDGIMRFKGNTVSGNFRSGGGAPLSGKGRNTVAVNSGGSAAGVGPGKKVVGTETIIPDPTCDLDPELCDILAEFDEFEVTDAGEEGGEGDTFAGVVEGTIDPDDFDDGEVLVGQFYQPEGPTEAVNVPMFFIDLDIGNGPDGPTLTLNTGAFEEGDTITTANLPEPAAAALLLGGLVGLGAYRRRRRS